LREGKSKLYSLAFSPKFWRDVSLLILLTYVSWCVHRNTGIQKDFSNAYLLQVVFLMPLMEELCFRGFLYSAFEKIGPKIAIVSTSFLSAFYNGFSGGQLVFSLILTVCFARERTILAPIILHLFIFVLGLFLP
jgi:membrane protease YdiL (CAAX protease family)